MWVGREANLNPRFDVDSHAHVGGGLCGFAVGSMLSVLRMHPPTKNEIARMVLSLLAVLTPLRLTGRGGAVAAGTLLSRRTAINRLPRAPRDGDCEL